MKTLIACLLFLSASGCSTYHKRPEDLGMSESKTCPTPWMKSVMRFPSVKQREEYEICAQAERQANDPDFQRNQALWNQGILDSEKFGASKADFDKFHVTPTEKELVDGKDVYWYDCAKPYFVVFKDGKLNSIMLDRETVRYRETNQRMDASAETQRRANMWSAIGSSIQQNQLGQIERNTRPVYQPQSINGR